MASRRTGSPRLAPQPRPIETGHDQVADDEVEGLGNEPREGRVAVGLDHDVVAVGRKAVRKQVRDLRLVVAHQNAPRATHRTRDLRRRCRRGLGRRLQHRQAHEEGGAAVRARLDRQASVIGANVVEAHRQT
jgi:hypothetical protein